MARTLRTGRKPGTGRNGKGFTLLEVVFAMALLGFSLLALFALHNVAIGSNIYAGRLSACTMLAQQQMEYLSGLPWKVGSALPSDLSITNSDPSSKAIPYAYFEHPTGTAGKEPSPINANGNTTAADGPLMYYRTWDVSYPFQGDQSIIEIKVRVIFFDKNTRKPHGVTVSSFRYQDSA